MPTVLSSPARHQLAAASPAAAPAATTIRKGSGQIRYCSSTTLLASRKATRVSAVDNHNSVTDASRTAAAAKHTNSR